MTTNISVSITGAVSGGNTFSLALALPVNANSPGQHTQQAIINGNTTLTPPSGAAYLVIVPPTTSTVTKTLKGVAGDTGVPISPNVPTVISLIASPGALVLTANGAENIDVYWI